MPDEPAKTETETHYDGDGFTLSDTVALLVVLKNYMDGSPVMSMEPEEETEFRKDVHDAHKKLRAMVLWQFDIVDHDQNE